MSITIELTPEIEAKINRNAEQSGIPLQDYIRQLLENTPAKQNTPVELGLQATLPPEEFAKVLREWSESHNWPALSEEAMSRESIYGDNH